ncbi:class I SAM-dependent methyltransferase [Janthinobacterium sp. PLB04]|uniref:Class I SAM-dependent methyltransferase n=1 Tax=Janthinobacterium lividum TaxID=29581 RepID=A0AAJ4T3N5_9BURK|nr:MULTISPECIES: class I SAM-dependent methyltransferase [Janthinobacterium]KAB0325522.1 class I SAM-dependent methyltransferase [Janthinobacterium lividum]QSX94624.1 class I SAM-dependent methyltransferase [Janthinobacterium lividum]UGQ34433.1 class I SAM-dependent methyltransferase [Janthinobacterium sp. PLB04]
MTLLTAAETYLQDFHQRQVGVTSTAFGHLPASSPAGSWASSYDVLTSLVPAVDTPLSVLDLACGDGHLLGLLAARRQPRLQLLGVDMSQTELAAARAALPPSVHLLQGRGQALDLPSASVDYLVSHMALMLMDDIEQVMREIRRVLHPGGQFAAIVGRTFLLGEVNDVFMRVFKPVASTGLPPLRFGDRRTGSEAGWRELLDAGFADVEVDDIDVPWTPTPGELWTALLDTYDIDRLDEGARQRLREAFLDAVAPLQADDGLIATGWGLRAVRARAA